MKWGAAICLGLATLALSVPATALCADPPGFAQGFAAAPLVFTGTVVSTSSSNRVALLEVDTVWKGSGVSVDASIWGTGDPFPRGGFMTTSSLDRSFLNGVRYVFFPTSSSDPYMDNSCTLTQELTLDLEEALAKLAGGPGSPPMTVAPDVQSGIPVWTWPALVAAVVAGTLLQVRRRRTTVEVEGFRTSGDRAAGPD
ncbi:MAG: hypothetical protein WD651_06285 [Acidimicrobiia bacterium]